MTALIYADAYRINKQLKDKFSTAYITLIKPPNSKYLNCLLNIMTKQIQTFFFFDYSSNRFTVLIDIFSVSSRSAYKLKVSDK